MAVNNYFNGTEVRLSASFTQNSVAIDPTTVVFRVRDPAGNITVYTNTVVKDSTGNYHQDILVGVAGAWWYRAEGTGVATVATEAQLNVKSSQF